MLVGSLKAACKSPDAGGAPSNGPMGGHPPLGTELAGQQARHVKVRIELQPVQAKARRADFDGGSKFFLRV